MLASDWFVAKVRASMSYAQNLYAAMCNMQWQKAEVLSILKDEFWSASWRSSGGIVAEIRREGDYMDWYCSGMGGLASMPDDDEEALGLEMTRKKYVAEGFVTDEIRDDLALLGWSPIPYDDEGI